MYTKNLIKDIYIDIQVWPFFHCDWNLNFHLPQCAVDIYYHMNFISYRINCHVNDLLQLVT